MWKDIVKIREAQLRAVLAEHACEWHLAIRDYLLCLEAAEQAGDSRATRFFALKLGAAYSAIGFDDKALYYRDLAFLLKT